jgi:hypothetical protein
MSSEHSREVLREIAVETADEGNVPGRSTVWGLLIAIAAVIALILLYVATATTPPQTARNHPSVSPPDTK